MRLDSIGTSMVILAVMLSLYFATFEQAVVTIYPTVLLLSGIYFMRYYSRVEFDTRVEKNSLTLYTALALGGIAFIGFMVPRIFVPQSIALQQMSVINLSLFAVLMAVSEECFFRGFLLSYFENKTGSSTIAILLQAVIWSVYHTAVYGSSPASMMYVVLSGIILGYVVCKTNTLTPAILAHSIVNFIASGGVI